MNKLQGDRSLQATRPHLGMAESELLSVDINGVQELLRGVLAVDELPFRDGTGVKDPVPEEKRDTASDLSAWFYT